MLRSGMMGWVSIMLDTTAWSPEQHAAARRAFSLYKQQLRPLIRDARLYHISDRPDGAHWTEWSIGIRQAAKAWSLRSEAQSTTSPDIASCSPAWIRASATNCIARTELPGSPSRGR